MDLMSVYINCNDEVSLLVLEQDWWKSFYRLNRFAKNSNFSEQPVRALIYQPMQNKKLTKT